MLFTKNGAPVVRLLARLPRRRPGRLLAGLARRHPDGRPVLAGGGGALLCWRGGAGRLLWQPGRPAGQSRRKHAGHGLVPGELRRVASGKQRHAAASVRRGLPERAAVRGGGGGGHHRVHRQRRQDMAGTGQSAARVIHGALPDHLRRAGFLLCHRAAGHHPGDTRRRCRLEPPCAPRRVSGTNLTDKACLTAYTPGIIGRPALCRLGLLDIACLSARVCYAVATAPPAYDNNPIPKAPHAAPSSIWMTRDGERAGPDSPSRRGWPATVTAPAGSTPIRWSGSPA